MIHPSNGIRRNVMVSKQVVAALFVWSFIPASALAADGVEAIRQAAKAEIENADTAEIFKKVELVQKYAAALDNLEKTLTASGNLDVIVRLREEREEVKKSGNTTSHNDKAIVNLHEKYLKALTAIDGEMQATRAKVAAGITRKISEQETELTKAGKVEDALALRKEGERLLLEFAGGAAADAVPFEDDPRVAAPSVRKELAPIKIPTETPALVEKPFSNKDRWLESLTVPVAKQKIREAVVIGDRAKKKWPIVVVTSGSVWSATDAGRIELSAGKLVASKCRFDTVPMGADLACDFYFKNCIFNKCRFEKVGVWYGSDQAGKFYFENCLIKDNFSKTINPVDNGFRIQGSVLEDIDLPSMSFKKRQPADYVNNAWLRIIHCRFVKCKIPLSFLLLTRDCIFENCSIIDDSGNPEILGEVTKPIEIVAYVSGSKWKIPALPNNVTLIEKPDTELKGVTIPTAASLSGLMGN